MIRHYKRSWEKKEANLKPVQTCLPLILSYGSIIMIGLAVGITT